jgi:polyisoprenoid-binding protein YceI
MRASIVAAVLLASACASVEGAANAPPPFTTTPAAGAAAADVGGLPDYPIAVDLPAGTYRLDPRHATVLFRIRHMDLAWLTARFDRKDATLELDPADPSRSRLSASVEAASVSTGVLSAQGEPGFDRAVARALGAEASPNISFVSTAIERTGAHTARVTGDLTLNGQTHPATLNVTFDGGTVDPLRGGAMVLGFSAHGAINRSQWGVNEWRAFTGDEVQIVIEAELVKS